MLPKVYTGVTYRPVQYGSREKNTRPNNPEAIAETKAHLTVGFHIQKVIVFFAEHGYCCVLELRSARLWVIVPNTGAAEETHALVVILK